MRLRINAWVRRRVGDDWEHFYEGDVVDDSTDWGRRLVAIGAASIDDGEVEQVDPVAEEASAPVVEEPATVPEPEPATAPTAGVERPKMTATVDVWREYAEANGVKTTGLSKKEIIGAMDSIGA